MDGDFADLPRLADLKRRYDALLIVDEAHATGIFGRQGRGVAELMQVEEAIDVTVGTLSKALGGIGGFIAASTEIIDLLVNVAGPFIYTTALPPAACAAALAALDLIEREPQRREKLLSLANRLRAELGDRLGFDLGGSTSQIVPIIVGEAEAAVQLSRRLEEGGFLIPAIRPPTVPRGRSRLRISLSAGHDPADVDRLVALLETFR
jgi:8-amino-7-oxononanoate synthase